MTTTKTTTRKAIILFNKPAVKISTGVPKAIIDSCANHNIEVIRTIYNQDKSSALALEILIEQVGERSEPVIVITDMETYLFIENILSCAILGSLMKMEKIEICIYQESYNTKKKKLELIFNFYTRSSLNLLSAATLHLSKLKRGVKAIYGKDDRL